MKILLTEDRNDGYEAFKQLCKDNDTYKAAAAICDKYGYIINPCCYTEEDDKGNLDVTFGAFPSRTNKYLPEIYYYEYRFGHDKSFKIQTSSFGSMELEEHKLWLDAQIAAHKMIEELSSLDLTTLHKIEKVSE